MVCGGKELSLWARNLFPMIIMDRANIYEMDLIGMHCHSFCLESLCVWFDFEFFSAIANNSKDSISRSNPCKGPPSKILVWARADHPLWMHNNHHKKNHHFAAINLCTNNKFRFYSQIPTQWWVNYNFFCGFLFKTVAHSFLSAIFTKCLQFCFLFSVFTQFSTLGGVQVFPNSVQNRYCRFISNIL